MPVPARPAHPTLKPRLLAASAAAATRALGCLWRLGISDPHRTCVPGELARPVIWIFWHAHILPMPLVYRRWIRHRRMVVLTSASRDGEVLARTMACFGLGAVRGSSSRRGALALRELVAAIRRGEDVIITPDGPRGPPEVMQAGVAQLAALTGAPVVPIRVVADRPWHLRTWDAFQVPRPFSRVVAHFGRPVFVPPRPSAEQFEQWRLRLEHRLRQGDGEKDQVSE